MIYGFSVLLFILGLVTGIPAIPQLWRMQKTRQNSATTMGLVHSDDTPTGGLMSSFVGKTRYPQIYYRTPNEKEHTIEILDNSPFKLYRYKSGEAVVVVYDKSAPWQAYLQKEWKNALRDLWMAAAEILVSIALWNIGLALHLPK